MSNKQQAVKPGTKKEQRANRSSAEWATLIISTVVILLVVGAITYSYLNKRDLPANISVKLQNDKIEKLSGEYYLPLEVRNEGSSVAEDVRVTVTHTVDKKEEKSEFTIHFLPGQGTQKAFVAFKQDPSKKGTIETDIGSYLKP